MGLADVPILSSVVDGTVLVVESGRTRRAVVRDALKRLHFARARVLGVVLSKYQAKHAPPMAMAMAMATAMGMAMATRAAPKNTSIAKIRSLPWTARSMTPNHALEAALALSRAPNMVRLLRRQPLPTGITLLLQMLAGDAQALNEATSPDPFGPELNVIAARRTLHLARHAISRRVRTTHPWRRGRRAIETKFDGTWVTLWGGSILTRAARRGALLFARRVLEAWRQY